MRAEQQILQAINCLSRAIVDGLVIYIYIYIVLDLEVASPCACLGGSR